MKDSFVQEEDPLLWDHFGIYGSLTTHACTRTMLSTIVGRVRTRAVGLRALCSDAAQQEIQTFLANTSRPKMGQAKAKQSAGKKIIDMSKQSSRLEGLDMAALLRTTGADLKTRGLPVQERKRLLRFVDKVRQGYVHEGKPGDWKGWRAPGPER